MNNGIFDLSTQTARIPQWRLGQQSPPATIGARLGFNPRTPGGLLAWYDASDPSTLFQNSNGTVPAVLDNDPVGMLADKSGNGWHMTQTTNNSRPLLAFNSQNGLPSLLFDGVNDYLFQSTVFVNRIFVTTLGVARLNNTTTDLAAVIASGRSGASGEVTYAAQMRNVFSSIAVNGAVFGRQARRNATWSLNFQTIPSPFVVASGFSNRHNVQVASDGMTMGVARDSFGNLGSGVGVNFWAPINVCEVLVYGRPLSLQEIFFCESYLSAKWGIALI